LGYGEIKTAPMKKRGRPAKQLSSVDHSCMTREAESLPL
jgi:hypothetical protein